MESERDDRCPLQGRPAILQTIKLIVLSMEFHQRCQMEKRQLRGTSEKRLCVSMISTRDAFLAVVQPSPAQTITPITASMGVHPFYHQEEGHSDDDHDGVVEHIDGEDEDGHVLLSITSITASMRFHPFHREKRRMGRISRCSSHRRHHCRQHHGRQHHRQHRCQCCHCRQRHGRPHPHDGMRPRLSL